MVFEEVLAGSVLVDDYPSICAAVNDELQLMFHSIGSWAQRDKIYE